MLLSVASPAYVVDYQADQGNMPALANTPPAGALTPAQLRNAYGINGILFQSNGATVTGDGAGQTIAIIDAYDDPSISADLSTFDQQFGIDAPPSFIKVGINSQGVASTTSFPSPNASWAGEIELDVEWAHAVAPAANIVLVEASSASDSALMAAVHYARSYPGVVAVSMSWGGSEDASEISADSDFTTPAGHAGVTFFSSSGDNSSIGYPAISSHVVGVGGTTLNVDSAGDYLGESAWSDSGGGLSGYEAQPGYQANLVIHNGSQTISAHGMRAGPDVASDGDPNTGVAVYGSYGFGGWIQVGGTSAAAPVWAGLMAMVDQGRAAAGLPSMDGYTQTLPALYALPSSDFHAITTGSNSRYSAGPGFNLVTGRGTPIANLLVPALAGNTGGGTSATPPTVVQPAQVVSSTATTVSLSARGTDAAGAASLTYTWTAIGPGSVHFSSNGTTSAQNTTATLTAAGTYTFEVTITDPSGLSVTSQVSGTVSPVMSGVGVTPVSATVAENGTEPFTATALDQFGAALAHQPASFSWSINAGGVGTISPTGLYTAPSSAGSATIHASSGAFSGSAKVTVASQSGTTTTLSAGPVSYYGYYALATLTVQVAPDSGGILPSGTVELLYGGSVLGNATVRTSNGVAMAQFPLEFFSNGNYTFTAQYLGSSSLQGSTSNVVTVAVGTSATPPTVVQPAQVVSSTATTVSLSALGTDAAGAASLTYTWTATGPGSVHFGSNGTNSAQNTTATLTAAGTYIFEVTITDPSGLSVTSQVSDIVNPVMSGVGVTPVSATVAENGTEPFTATALDQFGTALAHQPASFSWSIAAGGVGTISPTGLYTAPASAGSATIHASSGAFSGSAKVTVASQSGTTTTLSAGPVSYYGYYALATLTVQVTPNSGTVLPSGTVELLYGGSVLGGANLRTTTGVATAQFTLEFFANGNYTFTAQYLGSSKLQGSASNAVTVGVGTGARPATAVQPALVASSTSIPVSTSPPATGLPPTITSSSPNSGQAGTTVVISGTGFERGVVQSVTFGNVAAAFTVLSDTQIAATVPTSALLGAQSIGVTTTGGTASSAPFDVMSSGLIVVGPDAGSSPEIQTFDPTTNQQLLDFFAYDPSFTLSVRVAVGDVTGDGTPDIITGAGPGGGSDIRIFNSSTGALIREFSPYNPLFAGSQYIAAGDLANSGHADIVVGADYGGGPEVKVFDGVTGALLYDFMAYDSAFIGGVRVAVGDVLGNGQEDIITGAGPGGGPNVTVWQLNPNGTVSIISNFFAYNPAFNLGIQVAAGDVQGNGKDAIITGAGAGGGPNVSVFDAAGNLIESFLAYDQDFVGGVRVAAVQRADGTVAIVTAAGPGGPAQIAQFNGLTGAQIDSLFAYNPLFHSGIWVAGTT